MCSAFGLPDLKVRLGVGDAKTLEALAQEVQSGASRLMLLVRIAGRVQGNCLVVQFRNMSCRKVGMKLPTFRCGRKGKVQQRLKVVKEHSFIPNFGQERCQCARSYQVSI